MRERRDLTPYQRAELALKLEPVIARQAKEILRQPTGGLLRLTLENSPTSRPIVDTRKELSKLAAISDNTMAKAKAIAEKAPEERKEKVRGHAQKNGSIKKEVKSTPTREDAPCSIFWL